MLSAVLRNFLKYNFVWISCLVIAAYLSPYFILGANTHIRVHDNLDSNIVWYKLLAESGQIFTPGTLPNVINGLPRSTLASPFDIMVWLYVLFQPMTAYITGQVFMRFTAFFGMYVLLGRKMEHSFIRAGAALGFALLPFWPSGLLSIAGLPLALHIFLAIRSKGKKAPKYTWVTLILLPFFSNFILTFVFFLGLMGLLWLFDWIRTKQHNWVFFGAVGAMTFLYLAKNYLLLYGMFFNSSFTTHRAENDLGHNNLSSTRDLFLKNFIHGHTHDMALQTQYILPVIGAALLLAGIRNIKATGLLGLFLFNGALSLWYAFWYWEGWRPLKEQFMILNTFNFSRIHFLDPMIWYICFGLALTILWKHLPLGKFFVILIVVLQCTLAFPLTEEMKYSEFDTPTFKEFYSKNLFDTIETYIGKDQSDYRVVSIGMHPTIAQYNGFYTLDTYNNSFPLAYKHKFRKIIAPELEKSPMLKNYFDTWGSRLYMYSSELEKHYLLTKNSSKKLESLTINTNALANLGGDYIFSTVPITNYKENNLEFEKSFENKTSPWKIYLYKVDIPG